MNHLLPYIHKDFNKHRYWEPFLGSGALFFALKPHRAVLADLNLHLINCYKAVRNEPNEISTHLTNLSKKISQDKYYEIRDDFNINGFTIINAARFIFLNRTCFNGLFRVNKKGEFNVPYGHKKNPIIPDKDDILTISKILQNSTFVSGSFEDVLKDAAKGDFIYLDPPYPPLDKTSYFNSYTTEKFTHNDQEKLAEVAIELDKKGCFIMISNADLKVIRNLYRGWDIQPLSVVRWITCKKIKHRVKEIIIRNY